MAYIAGLHERWAFIGTWSYFVAGLFYLQVVFSKIPIIISWMLFGENRFTDDMANWLPILGIGFAIALTWVATRGVQKFSKLSDLGGVFTIIITVLFIVFAMLGNWTGTPSPTEITVETMTPTFDLGYFSTFSWLLFAVAGAEVAGTYAKETKNAKRNFPLAVLIATLMIALAYVIGSVAVSLVASPDEMKAAGLADSGFVVYQLLAEQWGMNGKIVVQLYSAIFLVTGIAAYIVWMESPIRAMFTDVPAHTFPKFLTNTDENGILKNALWTQCAILVVLIAVPMLGLGGVEGLLRLLTDLSSLSLVIPYLVLIAAYIAFKRRERNKEDFVIVKSKLFAMMMAAVCLTLGTAGFFGAGLAYVDSTEPFGKILPELLKLYGGPIFLILVGMGLVALNKSRSKNKLDNVVTS
nr:amino acid permease [Ostreibacterium oceani]